MTPERRVERSTSISTMPAAIAIQSAAVHPTMAENCRMKNTFPSASVVSVPYAEA